MFLNVWCLRGMGDTLNSPRAASPLMRLVEGEESWKSPDHLKVFLEISVKPRKIVLSPAWGSKRRLTTGVQI
ncbi:hypothetical protein TNCV_1186731 [Trichonephila clavipes]|nr:hypothetical protein TNCV_1186731 [Trichonephila clavipes]